MTMFQSRDTVSRRTALAGLGAGGLGLALASTLQSASAQDSTPAAMTGHPAVGTWIVNRNPDDTTDAPTLNVITADGAIIDPTMGVGGVWNPTGPRTWDFTLVGITVETLAGGGAGSYAVIRGSAEGDDVGDTISGIGSVTVVAADGTILFTREGPNTAMRVHVEPQDAKGMPITGFPEWTPAPPEAATPTS
jgi:hypothetical protein